ncbi:hypothetical protein EXIGLDRAFT_832421 [Exidia glandulosa HHB12029]|uniref:Uncharacterized protein n=1 Tax=Exidia glandulosa HHB12029 TaxID=1314781 RepID=A0A165LQ10_EXIGL|nr:hypothetical protein EXIGLDRAFT_832421 [Exidia glandulosa HHB12029]
MASDATGSPLLCALHESEPLENGDYDEIDTASSDLHPLTAGYCAAAQLPLELVMMVFDCVWAEDDNAALVLGGVCRHWRNIVHQTQKLWLNLVLGPRNPRGKAWLYLRRSKNGVRRLTLRGLAASEAFQKHRDEKRFNSVTSLEVHLLSDAHRFEYASISWWTSFHLPLLTSFNCVVPEDAATVAWFIPNAKTQLQRLEHLSISAPTFEFSHLPAMSMLKTLVLDMKRATRENTWRGPCASCCFEQILRWSPLLESVSLRGKTVETCALSGMSAPPFTLAHLKSLHLEGWFTKSGALSLLRLPALKSLHILPPDTIAAKSVLERLEDAGASDIEELRLRSIPDTDCSLLAPYIRKMSRLSILELSNCQGDIDDLLYKLVRADEPLPLEEIVISDCPALTRGAIDKLVYAGIPSGDYTTPILVHTLSVHGCARVTADQLLNALTLQGRKEYFDTEWWWDLFLPTPPAGTVIDL